MLSSWTHSASRLQLLSCSASSVCDGGQHPLPLLAQYGALQQIRWQLSQQIHRWVQWCKTPLSRASNMQQAGLWWEPIYASSMSSTCAVWFLPGSFPSSTSSGCIPLMESRWKKSIWWFKCKPSSCLSNRKVRGMKHKSTSHLKSLRMSWRIVFGVAYYYLTWLCMLLAWLLMYW